VTKGKDIRPHLFDQMRMYDYLRGFYSFTKVEPSIWHIPVLINFMSIYVNLVYVIDHELLQFPAGGPHKLEFLLYFMTLLSSFDHGYGSFVNFLICSELIIVKLGSKLIEEIDGPPSQCLYHNARPLQEIVLDSSYTFQFINRSSGKGKLIVFYREKFG